MAADDSAFVVLRAFTYPFEAHLACSALEAAGIEARLSDNHLVEAQWIYSHAVGGVKVWVRAEDEARAREVLDERARGDEPDGWTDDEQDKRQSERCPRCGSDDVGVFTDKRHAFLSWLVMGFPLFATSRRSVCRRCGQAFDAKSD